MREDDWRDLLSRLSAEWLSVEPPARVEFPDEVREARWLGFLPATEKQISSCERRLGVELPPSYKSFLQTTNGWRSTSPFIDRLWGTDEVDWFRVRNREWIDAWRESWPDAPPDYEGAQMADTLEVSDTGDSAILLLYPGVVDEHGEWQAWFFSNWGPGANRYPSFHALMEADYETFRRLVLDAPTS